MYSRRLRQLVGTSRRQAVEEPGQIGSGELPLERPGEVLVAVLEGEDPGSELLERGGVGRGEDLALEDAEVDLDLVEPARVDREMDGHEARVRFDEPSNGGLAAVRAAVVEDPEDTPRRAIRLGGHDLADEPAERLDAGPWLTAAEELGPMDVPGGKVLERPAALVLELDEHRMPRVRGDRRVAADASLDARLLVGADDELIALERAALPLAGVEVEHARRLALEVRVARKDPAAVGPGLDCVLAEPAPDSRVGDRADEPAPDHLGPDVGHVEPAERKAQAGRQLTRDRLDGDHERWGKNPAAGRSAGARPGRPGAPRRSACATWRRSGRATRGVARSRYSPGGRRPGARSGPVRHHDTVQYSGDSLTPTRRAPQV